jgi:hypothetical protein
MTTQVIPRAEWKDFLDSFSGRHDRWLVSLEVDNTDNTAETEQVEAHQMALEGITADLKDGESTISISVGMTPQERLTHAVRDPVQIEVQRTREGAEKELRIEGREGTTVVRLRSPVMPETIDGLM